LSLATQALRLIARRLAGGDHLEHCHIELATLHRPEVVGQAELLLIALGAIGRLAREGEAGELARCGRRTKDEGRRLLLPIRLSSFALWGQGSEGLRIVDDEVIAAGLGREIAIDALWLQPVAALGILPELEQLWLQLLGDQARPFLAIVDGVAPAAAEERVTVEVRQQLVERAPANLDGAMPPERRHRHRRIFHKG